jgi:peptidyl-prolyl cis-trans isomerase D
MLEFFRNAAKGWVAKVLLGLLVLSFSVWSIKDAIQGGGVKELATVGSERISSARFTAEMNRQMKSYTEQTGTRITFEDAKKIGLDLQVRDKLIAEAAMDAKANELNFRISDASIAQEVADNPQLKTADGAFDKAGFTRVLEANGMTEAGFFRAEQQLRQRTILGSSAELGRIPQVFLDADRSFKTETRTARFFSVSAENDALPVPGTDDLKKQYEATPQSYTAPEYRSIVVLKADPADTAARFEVSDAELSGGYDRLKTEFEVPERRSYLQIGFANLANAEKAASRIRAGEDFVKVAGELGFKATDFTFENKLRTDLLDEKIANTVFAGKLNEVIAPVQGSLTTALVKITGIQAGKKPTLIEVRDQLKKRLQMEKASEDIQTVFESVEEMRSNNIKFEDIAEKLNIPVLVVQAVSATGLDKEGKEVNLPGSDELLAEVFERDPGVEADALTVGEGYVWYEVRAVVPSALIAQKDVEPQVRKDWETNKRRELTRVKAEALVAKSKSGMAFDELAKETGAAIRTIADLKRGQARPDFDGLASIALFSVAEKSATWAFNGDGKSANIILADKVTSSVPAAEFKERLDELTASYGQDMQQSLVKAVQLSVPVKINEELWDRLSGAAQAP